MYCTKIFLCRVGRKCKPCPHMCRIEPGYLAIVPEAVQMPHTSIKGHFSRPDSCSFPEIQTRCVYLFPHAGESGKQCRYTDIVRYIAAVSGCMIFRYRFECITPSVQVKKFPLHLSSPISFPFSFLSAFPPSLQPSSSALP